MRTALIAARDIARYWREQGAKAALAYLRVIVRAQLYLDSDEIVISKDLPPVDPAATGTIQLEGAQAHHLPMLAEFNRRQSNATRTHRFEAGLAEGKRALLGFRDGTLIGYIWWQDAAKTATPCYLARFGVGLAEGEVYGYDLFIAPEHRGRGTPAAFVGAVEAELVRLGYRRMYGFVDAFNTPARWLWTTSGYKVVTRRHTRRILRWIVIEVEGEDEGWLHSVRHALLPHGSIGFLGRRD
jgi:GNAT superfamily N-acetyltransferase